MSATADAGLFAGYFEAALGAPSGQLTIPGFTHPVTGGWAAQVVPHSGPLLLPELGGCCGSGFTGCGGRGTCCCGVLDKMAWRTDVCPRFAALRCTDMFLEDALEATGLLIGKSSKWAKKGGGGKSGGGKDGGGGGKDGDENGSAGGAGGYSEQTRISLSNVDEALINTDLIEALVAHLLSSRAPPGGGGGKRGGGSDDANAILIFAPGGAPAG